MKKYLLTKLHETRNKKKKGFTLVELIVVLVILAILAALLIPALTGYIDNANEKKVTAEARTALMAAQTVVSDVYGTEGKAPTKAEISANDYAMLEKYAEGYQKNITDIEIVENKITKLVYENDDITATYTAATSDAKAKWNIN